MLEPRSDQIGVLPGWGGSSQIRVVPVVATASGALSRELVWVLERAFQAQGHPVVVLDGLPGIGVKEAVQGHRVVLRRLLKGVTGGCVVLLHAPLEALAVLLGDSQARPLVALDQEKASVLEAYGAIKVLVYASGVSPIILALSGADGRAGRKRAEKSLLDCCRQRLDMAPTIWPLEYHGESNGCCEASPEANLLKVLESAVVISSAGISPHVFKRIRQPQSEADAFGVSDVQRQRHT